MCSAGQLASVVPSERPCWNSSGRLPGSSTGRPIHQPRPVAAASASLPYTSSISTPMRPSSPLSVSTRATASTSSRFSAGRRDSSAPASRASS